MDPEGGRSSASAVDWLKADKRVSTRKTQGHINNALFARKGGMLRLAKYRLTIPISQTIAHLWVMKLGCQYDRAKQSYYTDGHKRAGVI